MSTHQKDFFRALESEIGRAILSKKAVSLRLGMNEHYISKLFNKRVCRRETYDKLIEMFPALKNAPKPNFSIIGRPRKTKRNTAQLKLFDKRQEQSKQMNTNTSTFAEQLLNILYEKNVTYKALAKKINVNHTTISNLIRKNSTSINTYNNIINVFPELKDAPQPTLYTLNGRPLLQKENKVNNDVTENSKAQHNHTDEFVFALSLHKLKSSDIEPDLKNILKFMIDNNIPVNKLYNSLTA